MKAVDILLSTYNGEKHLLEQLESLKTQTFKNFNLIIRDDGSQDKTLEIISSYRQLPRKERLGVTQSFSTLLKNSSSDYTFFSDQDDIWLPFKVEASLKALKEAEKAFPKTPLLLHTDLSVVDSHKKMIAPSFWRYSGLNPIKTSTFNRLLIQNTVTGCSMVINKELKELIGLIPKEAIMHDWWLALLASAFGKVISLPTPTLLYRQHTQNVLGAQKFSLQKLLKKGFNYLSSSEDYEKRIKARFNQAKAFQALYGDLIPQQNKVILEAFLEGNNASWLKKREIALKHKFFRNTITQTAAAFCLKSPF